MTKQSMTVDFLRAIKVVGADGELNNVHFVATIENETGITRHYPARTVEGLIAHMERWSRKTNVYIAVAEFLHEKYIDRNGNTKRRTGDDATGAACLWIDIDCGPDKSAKGAGYLDQKTAIDAIKQWCKAVELPKPNVLVNSGRGIHAYWTFGAFIDKAEWQELAKRLKKLTKAPGKDADGNDIAPLLADDTRTADIASIMRLPGAFHVKDPADPRPVEVLLLRDHVDFGDFAARLRAGDTTGEAKGGNLSDLSGGLGTPKGTPCMKLECTPENRAFVARALAAAGLSVDSERSEWMRLVWSVMSLGPDAGWTDFADELSQQSDRYTTDGFANVRDSYAEGQSGFESVLSRARANGFSEPTPTPVEGTGQQPAHHSGDIRLADFFAARYAGKLMYLADRKAWARWDGTTWADCDRGENFEFAKETATHLAGQAYRRLAKAPDDERLMKQTNRLVGRVMSAAGIAAMVQLASSDPRLVALSSDFDNDPDLLCVTNGYIDLRNGKHFEPDPDKRMRRMAAAKFDPAAKCPRWEQFLIEIFQGDLEVIEFIQRAIGYSITGHAGEEKLFICHGLGANGKSIFADTITRVFDGYTSVAPPSLLVRKDNDGGPSEEMARLNGARIVQINELKSGDRLNEQTVKLLAGREKLAARFMYGSFFEFWPSFSPWLRTNHRPIVTGEDDGIWRRLVLIPFARKFEPHEREPHLEQRLWAERDGVLKWAVEGAVKWSRDGLRIPESIQRESLAYRKESDILGSFLEDKTIRDPMARMVFSELWLDWQAHCQADGLNAGSKQSFGRRLKERGYDPLKSNGIVYCTGLSKRNAKPATHLTIVKHDGEGTRVQ